MRTAREIVRGVAVVLALAAGAGALAACEAVPEPAPSTSAGFVVPDLVGLTREEAVVVAEDAGFEVSDKRGEVFTGTTIVEAQVPIAGTRSDRGGTIVLDLAATDDTGGTPVVG